MATERVERRLAAILAADVAGYSRLMEADEEGTHARLKALRRELIDPQIGAHRGRVFKTTGDGILIEFPSVVDAVRCAVAVQEGVLARSAQEPPEIQIALRVGINLGDVLVDGEDIHGDGVNIAARLEALATPGGICISQTVLNHARGKVPLEVEDAGAQALKNIDRPVHVYRVVLGAAKAAEGGVGIVRAGARADAGARVLPRPDKPAIVVLPFVNMSGDPEQEFFADGLTEDIITELARFHELLVISRNSAFVHKGKAVRVQDVAREFGVHYVVEGSVRKAGERVRVTVQLIDADADRHVWAERYDRKLEDIFAIQDEVTAAIVATLPGRIEAASHERAKRKPTDNMAAYECVLTAKVLHHRSTSTDNAESLRLLERALALDSNYAHAHAWRGCVLGQSWVHGWCADRDETFAEVGRELELALALDDDDADVHRILAALCLNRGDHERAAYHQERALALNPNYDLVVVQQGELLTWIGRPEEGIDWIKKAMRINPHHPERFWNHLGRAYFVARRYGEAVEAFNRISRPDHTHHAFLAAAHAQLGNQEAAAAHVAAARKAEPSFAVATYLATLHYRQDADRAHHREALLKAGFPDGGG